MCVRAYVVLAGVNMCVFVCIVKVPLMVIRSLYWQLHIITRKYPHMSVMTAEVQRRKKTGRGGKRREIC